MTKREAGLILGIRYVMINFIAIKSSPEFLWPNAFSSMTLLRLGDLQGKIYRD